MQLDQTSAVQKKKILWIGLKPLFQNAHVDSQHIESAASAGGLRADLYVIQESTVVLLEESVLQIRKNDTHGRIFVIGDELPILKIQSLINEHQVTQIFDTSVVNMKSIAKQIENRLEDKAIGFAEVELLQESKKQMREFEVLTQDLEKIVAERTRHIELSKLEEDEKLNKARALIKFIKELGLHFSFEEILILLRKELRKFGLIGDPTLIYQLHPELTHFVAFQNGNLTQTESRRAIQLPSQLVPHDVQLGQVLANHFGRPFLRAIAIPIEVKLIQKFGYEKAAALVVVEIGLQETELGSFFDFIIERVQPLSMAIDRLLLENELTKSGFRWEKTFDNLRDPIAITDLEFEVVRANKKFAEKASRKKCYESFANRELPCEGCPMAEALTSGTPSKGQISRNGRLYQVHSYPIRIDHGGRPTNVVNQYVDITQSRELYLRMLQNEKMGAIGMLAGNIAHELNNPLTGLKSLTQILIGSVKKGSQIFNDLKEIEKATERSHSIIKNLLEFSKGSTEQNTKVSMDEIVQKTLPFLKTMLRMHKFDLNLDSKDALVFVEPYMMQQVVFNLVNNSCQAMKDAGTLSLYTGLSEDKNFVELWVRDTGPGVPLELREKIFEPFFTTKRDGMGTGLGLSLSRKIVEGFGGHLKLVDAEGPGAAFLVSLPRVQL